jgi:hypothetical protein
MVEDDALPDDPGTLKAMLAERGGETPGKRTQPNKP